LTMTENKTNLVGSIESVAEQIQVLALNIAVAAAKLSYRKQLDPDVNDKVSKLVNQATLAVKGMNNMLRAVKHDKPKKNILDRVDNADFDAAKIREMENTLAAILDDSQKIVAMLQKVKQGS
jgi:ABC-type phosphate/phosphonate transport system substrate-binding protein